MKKLFRSPDGRLRSGWRLTIQSLLTVAGMIFFALPVAVLVSVIQTDLLNGLASGLSANQEFLIGAPAQLLAVTAAVYIARLRLDRRSFSSLGLQLDLTALADLLVGFGLPLVILGVIFVLTWSLGWLRIQGFAWEQVGWFQVIAQTLLMLVVFSSVGWYEELLFRGYWLQNLAEGLSVRWAILISSLVFSLAHTFNPDYSVNALLGLLLAGVFFAYAYQQTGQLWLPIGVHIGWNFFEGTIYGFRVSGLDAFRLVQQSIEGPALWTGGGFGPEAGLMLLPGLAIGTLLVYLYAQLRKPTR